MSPLQPSTYDRNCHVDKGCPCLANISVDSAYNLLDSYEIRTEERVLGTVSSRMTCQEQTPKGGRMLFECIVIGDV